MVRHVVVVLTAFLVLAIPAAAMAQGPGGEPVASLPVEPAADGLISGQIGATLTDESGALVGFVITDKDGRLHGVTLGPDTQFGLDSSAGERWVATYGDDPEEALARIVDQRGRFAAVTVTVSGGVAESVVGREESDLEQNLGYLLAIYLVTWGGFFLYVFIVSRRQRDLSRELSLLRQQVRGLEATGGATGNGA